MADDAVVAERGVLTAPARAWDLAARRASVIRELAAQRVVSLEDADAAAARLGVSRRQVYVLVGRWRAGEGLVSDLLPGTSSGGRGGGRLPDDVEALVREVLRTRYLTRQRRTAASVCREIARECKARGLRVPSRGTVLRRIAMLDPVRTTSAREGQDAARALKSAGGVPPAVTGLLEQALDWPVQEAMFHAAAVALQLAADGTITPRGVLGSAVRPAPQVYVFDGDQPHRDPWADLMEEVNAAGALARRTRHRPAAPGHAHDRLPHPEQLRGTALLPVRHRHPGGVPPVRPRDRPRRPRLTPFHILGNGTPRPPEGAGPEVSRSRRR